MKKILLIIDPQNDFISGSLPVPGAAEAMDKLADFVNNNAENIDTIYITTDQHPAKHCSFLEYGGIWPTHCVKYSQGAAVYPPLFEALLNYVSTGKNFHFIEKGNQINLEEYSAFHTTVPVAFEKAESILLCGIAGDVCVLNSLNDLCNKGLAAKITLLHDYIASLDGGEKLRSFVHNPG